MQAGPGGKSGLGKSEPGPRLNQLLGRIVHVHIPKTAGSALQAAFRQTYGDQLRSYPEHFESRYGDMPYSGFNFYAGHIGYKIAREIGGDLITILRDPVDRFLSTYFYLRQLHESKAELSHKTSLAARYDLDQFIEITDEPDLEAELHNRMTWQLAHSHRVELREELTRAGVTDQDVLRMAVSNLGTFAIVGLQTDMAGFVAALRQRYNAPFAIGRLNVTNARPAKTDLSLKTIERIRSWLYLDEELYGAWVKARE